MVHRPLVQLIKVIELLGTTERSKHQKCLCLGGGDPQDGMVELSSHRVSAALPLGGGELKKHVGELIKNKMYINFFKALRSSF